MKYFFDLEKAYDSNWKGVIMKDLHEMGPKGRLPIFIDNFLKGRKFKVRLDNTHSSLNQQEEGVPQGSNLSPTLFTVKINSIVDALPEGIEKSLYVDDLAVYCQSSNMAIIERRLQGCLDKLVTCADENGFKFSPTKMVYSQSLITNYMDNSLLLKSRSNFSVFSSTGSSILFHILNIWKISVEKHYNYFELYPARIGVVTGQPDWGFTGLIRSKLDYVCIVYGSAKRSYLAVLDPIANHGLRLCSGAFRTSPIESLQVETDEPSLETRRLKLSLQYYMKMKANPENPAYSCVVNPEYKRLFNNKPGTIPTLV